MKICISIGHGKSKSGGYDSGAVGGGYHEFKLAREIGKYTKDALASYDCIATVINYDGNMCLAERINYANKNSYDLAMEIHLNAGGGTGSEVYYKKGNTQGKNLAGAISKSIATTFDTRNRGAKTKVSDGVDYFGFVREIKYQSLLVETVFIDTKSDRDKVATAAGQKKCGQAIANAIASFYSLKLVTVKPSTPSNTAKFAAGDTVKITGTYYATGQKIPAWVKLCKHTVKSVSGDRVLLKEINSYVKASDLQLVSTAKKGIAVGSTVKITGKYYATGQKIPVWVKLKKHTVKNIDDRAEKALLKEINSWVWVKDLTIVKSASKGITVGSTVTIKSGAVYGGLSSARGKAVPKSQCAPTKHKVTKIQTNKGVKEALLGDISSWVAVSSLTEV